MARRLIVLLLGTFPSFLWLAHPTQSSGADPSKQELSPRELLHAELKSLRDEASEFKKITMEAWMRETKPPASDESIRLICGRSELDLGIQSATIVDTLVELHDRAKCGDDKTAIEGEINKYLSQYQSTVSGVGAELEVVATKFAKDSKEQQIATDAAARFKKLFFAIGKIKLVSFPNAKKFGEK